MKRGESTSLLMALMVMGFGAQALAQDDPLLSVTDNVVNTEEIDIEGLYSKKKAPSAADRIQKLRRDLEEKHEQMMRKRVEAMRLEEEKKLAEKLRKALNGQMKAMDSVSTYSAAPVQQQAVKMPVVKSEEKTTSVKISGGFMNISSQQNDLDANANIAVGFEGKVAPKVAVGVNVRYVKVDMTDESQSSYNTFSNQVYSTNTNNVSYQNGRDLSYKQISFGAYGKFYFVEDTKIKPFVGAGLSYNRGTYKYQDVNTTYTSVNGYQYGNEDEVLSNNLAGSVLLGAEVMLGDQFSAELSFAFERALTSGVSDSSSFNKPDEQSLRNLASDLEEANIASLNAGLSFHF